MTVKAARVGRIYKRTHQKSSGIVKVQFVLGGFLVIICVSLVVTSFKALHRILGDAAAGSQSSNLRASVVGIPEHHHQAHVEADSHIVDHWKNRAAQMAPKHDAQHDAPVDNEQQPQQQQQPLPEQQHDPQQKADQGDEQDVSTKRFIVFYGIAGGQGTGNVISGLLAAHLYGVEFDRIVCLAKGVMTKFFEAYEPIHPDIIRYCPLIANNLPPVKGIVNSFDVLTYSQPPNECELQKLLKSDEQIIYMGGNTYPRWPVVPKNFFVQYYQPREVLRKYLPSPQPEIVVHLRLEDGPQDKRKGLDPDSLKALGNLLPRDTTYLVTNNVPWYDYFEKEFGWKHPDWHLVVHSAGLGIGRWGSRGEVGDQDHSREVQNMQMWSDWNSILMAKKVYHTHSDFSVSAIHWMDIDSKSIQGFDTTKGELILFDESWRVSWREEGVTPRLIDRTKDGEGIARLRCSTGLSGLFANRLELLL